MALAGWIDRATWDRAERGVEPARLCRFDLRGVWLDIRRGLVESQLNMGDGAPTPRGSFVRQASLYNVAPLTPKARIPFALRECACSRARPRTRQHFIQYKGPARNQWQWPDRSTKSAHYPASPKPEEPGPKRAAGSRQIRRQIKRQVKTPITTPPRSPHMRRSRTQAGRS